MLSHEYVLTLEMSYSERTLGCFYKSNEPQDILKYSLLFFYHLLFHGFLNSSKAASS